MTNKFNTAIKSPVRTVQGKADLYYRSSTSQYSKLATYTQDDYLKSIKIERIADEGKFFGFGVSHKANIKLRDVNRELNITVRKDEDLAKRCFFVFYIGTGDEYCETQRFYITETHRDENTNELSITAYDALYFTTTPIGSMVKSNMVEYTAEIMNLVKTSNQLLLWNGWNGGIVYENCTEAEFTKHTFKEGANFESTATCREVLDDIAEATHTIYFINNEDKVVFKRPDRDGDPVLTITRSDYIKLKSGDNRRLAKVTHATELGDNVSAAMTISGTNQIMRDNEFFAKMSVEDMTAAIDTALANMGGMTINQFDCSWRGNPALEPGDKVALITKDGDTVFAYCYNDTIEYDGTLEQKSEWKYTADENETESTPTSLGEVIKQVYAKVDRVNKEISLVVSEEVQKQLESGIVDDVIVSAVQKEMSSITLNTDEIKMSVLESAQEIINDSVTNLEDEIATLKQETSMIMTKDQVEILIQQTIESEDITSVITGNGFTFNDEGLTITKAGSEMSTNIDEDGMTITRNGDEVLVADNEGVKAEDLHATTYLIVGRNSRFEDYDNKKRTGCFWIGG
jgi:hypothetical protein